MTPSTNTTTPMSITVEIRDVYGRPTIYPACPTAEKFAALTGTKTLTGQALNTIRSLGYTVTVMQRNLP
jgi:hypothetical protein